MSEATITTIKNEHVGQINKRAAERMAMLEA